MNNIRINQTWTQIGIQTQSAKLELNNNGKTDFAVNHTEPQIQMQTVLPKVQIDQSAAFADEGHKNLTDFKDERVALAQQTALNYIGQTAEEGDRYAKINIKTRALPEIIKSKRYQTNTYDVGSMPEHGPEIGVNRGEVNLQLIQGEVQTNSSYVPIAGTYTPGQVSYFLRQEGGISFEYVGGNIDTKI